MKITFLTPHIKISGGIKLILGYADRLAKKGHAVTVVCPQSTFARMRIEGVPIFFPHRLLMNLVKYKPKWIQVAAKIKYVPSYDERYIPDADIVIATAWQTSEYVNNYPLEKGKKFHLFMHYERLWDDGCDDVDTFSYKLALKKIVISSCLQKFLKRSFNVDSLLIIAPIDHEIFYPVRDGYNKDKRICMLYQPYRWKGVEDGIRAYEIAKVKHPEIQLVMFGPRKEMEVRNYEYHYNLTNHELRELYNSCDIFLCPSWREGFGLPSAEAMACGCALITTDHGGCRDYAYHEKTALVSPPKNPEELADNLVRILEDEKLFRCVAENGYKHIKKFAWDKAVDKMEKVFLEELQKE